MIEVGGAIHYLCKTSTLHKYIIYNKELKMMVENDFDSSNESKKQVEKSNNGKSVSIEVLNPDIQTAFEDALYELYFYYTGRKFISLRVNDLEFMFEKCDNMKYDVFKVSGIKYTSGSDVSLKKNISFGKISIDKFVFYTAFHDQMCPLFQSWVRTINAHK